MLSLFPVEPYDRPKANCFRQLDLLQRFDIACSQSEVSETTGSKQGFLEITPDNELSQNLDSHPELKSSLVRVSEDVASDGMNSHNWGSEPLLHPNIRGLVL